MALSRPPLVLTAFALAAGAALLAGRFAVQLVEERSEIEVRSALDRNGLTWAEVEADGLRVLMAGEAPTEALRFRALSLAGSVVDAARLVDEIEVTPAAPVAAPRFSAELLRNASGLSIIGLIPASLDRKAMMKGVSTLKDVPVTDLLETADYPVPAGWQDAMAFALNAIRELPRAKISVEAGRVSIDAIADSAEDKEKMENRLRRQAPPALRVALNITAPRPVISPFTLRFVKTAEEAHFDTCSADTDDSRTRILAAARASGLTGSEHCTIGMGVPTPNWAQGVEVALAALADLGEGTVTFSDAQVTLAAAEGTDPALFDRIVGELETGLPEVFVLNPILPVAAEAVVGPPEFVATLSPEGHVQLRGRIEGEHMREVADSFAKAKFGSDRVYTAARVVSDLPPDWATRVLTAVEALSLLSNGAVTVTPDLVTLSGRSGDPEAGERIARLMVEKLGESSTFEIDVTYQAPPDPVPVQPSPEDCEAYVSAIVKDRKINFEPGSATIDEAAVLTMNEIAEVLSDCGDLRLEVQGHTDSQGREEMNLALSQSRAESVLNELRARRVLTSSFVAKGYGESVPIAENDTEEGREANRRIEFRLIRPEPSVPQGESVLESIAKKGDTGPDGE